MHSLTITKTDESEVVISHLLSIDYLTLHGELEPANDRPIRMYVAYRLGMVETGDTVYEKKGEQTNFHDVVYASTRTWPSYWPSLKAPYCLFVQLEKITDPDRLEGLANDLADLDALPF